MLAEFYAYKYFHKPAGTESFEDDEWDLDEIIAQAEADAARGADAQWETVINDAKDSD